MPTTNALLDGVAAGYRLDLDGAAYLEHLVAEAAPLLDGGLGVMGCAFSARRAGGPAIDRVAVSRRFDPVWRTTLCTAVIAALDVGAKRPPGRLGPRATHGCAQASHVREWRPLLSLLEGIAPPRDVVVLHAQDASGSGLLLVAPLRTRTRLPPRRLARLSSLAAHLAAALRIRRGAGLARGDADQPPRATPFVVGGAREALHRATLAYEHARAHVPVGATTPRTPPRRARMLLDARWALLDDFDVEGRRFVVAMEHPRSQWALRTELSERERQVLSEARRGYTDKEIAYELGLSVSTVRVLVHRASTKLGGRTRPEVLARFDAIVDACSEDVGTPVCRSVVRG